jgi:hypothetical protein
MGKNTFRNIIAESKTITPSKPFQDGELLVEPVTRDSILAEEYARMDEECQHDVIAEFTHAATELATTRAALYSAQYFLDKQLPDVRAATQTANSSKEELEKFATTISSAVKDAKEFTFKTALKDDALTQLDTAHDNMVKKYSEKITEYGKAIDAKHEAIIKTFEKHEEKFSNILAKPSDGIWLSQGMTWLCLTLLILFSLFFGLTIYANYAVIHSAELSKFLWTFGLSFAAIFGAVVFYRIKFT